MNAIVSPSLTANFLSSADAGMMTNRLRARENVVRNEFLDFMDIFCELLMAGCSFIERGRNSDKEINSNLHHSWSCSLQKTTS